MPTTEVYFKGKAKWAHTSKPDKFGNYSVVLYPDDESLTKIRELKDGKPPILNVVKKDEDGYNVKFSCPQNKTINGRVQVFSVLVMDVNKNPVTALLGNGSDITIKCDLYTYRRGEGKAIRLKAIRVDNLVPYEPDRDFTEDQKAQAGKIAEQPIPLF